MVHVASVEIGPAYEEGRHRVLLALIYITNVVSLGDVDAMLNAKGK